MGEDYALLTHSLSPPANSWCFQTGTTCFSSSISPHRAEAFDACRALIDELKQDVPIWKHQEFAGGDSEWVNSA